MQKATAKELLSDHLPYELLMLRYTFREIHLTQPALRWNALFESFAAHARSLHEFLTGKSDNRNVHATDLVPDFKPSKPDRVRGKVDALNQKILHLGTTRSAAQNDKINLGDAKVLFDWLEANVEALIQRLPNVERKNWKPERSVLAMADTTSIDAPVAASATNHIQIVQSSHDA